MTSTKKPTKDTKPEKKKFSREEKKQYAEKKAAERLEKSGGMNAIELFYDRSTREFLMKDGPDFEALPEAKIKLHLIAAGINPYATHETGVPMLDWPFLEATKSRKVDYAGSIPGWRKGLHTHVDGRKFLITSEAQGVFDDLEKLKKNFEDTFIPNFLFELLGREQAEHYCYSLNAGLKSLRRGDFRSAPFTWLVGPPECGKSLLQFITKIFYGGRSASPASVLFKNETKTGHLTKGEFWMFSDPDTGNDRRSRTSLGENLKAMFHEEEYPFRGLYREEFVISCFRRGSGGLNRKPEQIQLIPPLIEGVKDKNTVLLCNMAKDSLNKFCSDSQKSLAGFDPSSEGVDRLMLRQLILDSIPQFRAWIMENYNNVPEKWRNKRYGVAAYHNAELLRALNQLTPEARYLEYIDEVLFLDGDYKEYGSALLRARKVENIMRESKFAFQVKDFVHKTSQYFSRLEESVPERISKAKYDSDGIQLWQITNPFRSNTES